MNVKKAVIERIVKSFQREMKDIDSKIMTNSREMSKMVFEQTVLKREKQKIYAMIKDLPKFED